jgi:hypothetical protein
MAIDLGKLRWLMIERESSSASLPWLVILVFWLAIVSPASAYSPLQMQPLFAPYSFAPSQFQPRSTLS